ncbi:YezD family protein [Jeotgalibacillus proteolyticus]|uniref:DUF2292 domain-containing protein n=1 Tax=Jeotgalibacillus proteolyticus TaxID=2082395 RepID=A0A2S5G7S8_9BACL|nr:YezD family protein [Jeotgalibacillus proteolyticus]PPA69042.1 DUF2292 domain-containing protein [Jeotgalibacillus proteolyticus]
MAIIEQEQIDHIISSLERLQFGTLTITVHDGKIQQVDQTEKKRFDHSGKKERKRTPSAK